MRSTVYGSEISVQGSPSAYRIERVAFSISASIIAPVTAPEVEIQGEVAVSFTLPLRLGGVLGYSGA